MGGPLRSCREVGGARLWGSVSERAGQGCGEPWPSFWLTFYHPSSLPLPSLAVRCLEAVGAATSTIFGGGARLWANVSERAGQGRGEPWPSLWLTFCPPSALPHRALPGSCWGSDFDNFRWQTHHVTADFEEYSDADSLLRAQ